MVCSGSSSISACEAQVNILVQVLLYMIAQYSAVCSGSSSIFTCEAQVDIFVVAFMV